jgi:hypothetical protein
VTPEVQEAVHDLRQAFGKDGVDVDEEEQQGGAYVVVRDLLLGDQYEPSASWCGFLITFQYPRADVYPHFFDPSLRRRDGRGLGNGFSLQTWRGVPALQVSRRSNRHNAATDTAALKLAKVIEWIRTR